MSDPKNSSDPKNPNPLDIKDQEKLANIASLLLQLFQKEDEVFTRRQEEKGSKDE